MEEYMLAMKPIGVNPGPELSPVQLRKLISRLNSMWEHEIQDEELTPSQHMIHTQRMVDFMCRDRKAYALINAFREKYFAGEQDRLIVPKKKARPNKPATFIEQYTLFRHQYRQYRKLPPLDNLPWAMTAEEIQAVAQFWQKFAEERIQYVSDQHDFLNAIDVYAETHGPKKKSSVPPTDIELMKCCTVAHQIWDCAVTEQKIIRDPNEKVDPTKRADRGRDEIAYMMEMSGAPPQLCEKMKLSNDDDSFYELPPRRQPSPKKQESAKNPESSIKPESPKKTTGQGSKENDASKKKQNSGKKAADKEPKDEFTQKMEMAGVPAELMDSIRIFHNDDSAKSKDPSKRPAVGNENDLPDMLATAGAPPEFLEFMKRSSSNSNDPDNEKFYYVNSWSAMDDIATESKQTTKKKEQAPLTKGNGKNKEDVISGIKNMGVSDKPAPPPASSPSQQAAKTSSPSQPAEKKPQTLQVEGETSSYSAHPLFYLANKSPNAFKDGNSKK
ncbi:hypothetical protein EMPS_04272 [Entomortierella parvispora]|uniref:Uncharacterized protein n=1 Tax=Entomortierella parvispora TaxID=205924 RepID=A0A9P3H8D9_9FUNG|nr:hypothetical protein EMPS_04272 [Entomortierella parvispora]